MQAPLADLIDPAGPTDGLFTLADDPQPPRQLRLTLIGAKDERRKQQTADAEAERPPTQ